MVSTCGIVEKAEMYVENLLKTVESAWKPQDIDVEKPKLFVGNKWWGGKRLVT